MEQVGRDDGVGHAGFIFQTYKHKSFCSSWALADNDAAADAETLAAGNVAQFAGAANSHGIEPFAAVGHGMRAYGQSGAVEVGDQALFVVHGLQWRGRVGLGLGFEQRGGGAGAAVAPAWRARAGFRAAGRSRGRRAPPARVRRGGGVLSFELRVPSTEIPPPLACARGSE